MVQNDEFIELSDIVPEGASGEDGEKIIDLLELAPDDGDDSAVPPITSGTESKGEPRISTPVDGSVLGGSAGSLDEKEMTSVSRADVEAALERVIEKKFSQTIEPILFEVMEKVIGKEIADIKASLQKDLDDIGKS